jgi:hypothetical protein
MSCLPLAYTEGRRFDTSQTSFTTAGNWLATLRLDRGNACAGSPGGGLRWVTWLLQRWRSAWQAETTPSWVPGSPTRWFCYVAAENLQGSGAGRALGSARTKARRNLEAFLTSQRLLNIGTTGQAPD